MSRRKLNKEQLKTCMDFSKRIHMDYHYITRYMNAGVPIKEMLECIDDKKAFYKIATNEKTLDRFWEHKNNDVGKNFRKKQPKIIYAPKINHAVRGMGDFV